MPTILVVRGIRIVIYFNDHGPAHIHAHSAGCDAVFELACPGGPPSVSENYGFSNKSLTLIADALMTNMQMICDFWSALHGHY